jgi:hypothetical protein
MNKQVFIILSIVTWFFSSCDVSEDIPLLNELTVTNRMASGTWKITKLVHENTTKTADYNGVSFDFDAISVVVNNTGTLPVAGGWGVTDEGFEGAPELVFTMALTSVEPRFITISEDWDIIESTSTRLKLKDENLDTNTTDYLTFEKN